LVLGWCGVSSGAPPTVAGGPSDTRSADEGTLSPQGGGKPSGAAAVAAKRPRKPKVTKAPEEMVVEPSTAVAAGSGATAAPDNVVAARVSLSTMYYKESQAIGAGGDQLQTASPDTLLAADLRGLITAQRIAGTLWSSTLDFRLRGTGSYRPRSNTDTDPLITARGYRGGREYDLRQLYGQYDGSVRLTVGRQVVVESDATQIDGLRAVVKKGRWELGGFGGLFPDPFARNLSDDYRSDLVYAFGATGAFRYSTMYGSVATTALLPRGNDDGDVVANGVVGPLSREKPRVFTSFTGFAQPNSFVDLFGYLVVDAVSEAGPQLTNGHLLANLHPDSQLRVQVSYHHMASLAIELFLRELLIQPRGGTVENNLVVQRVARDEARLLVDYYLDAGRRYDVFAEGRIRHRSAIQADNDPVSSARGAQLAQEFSAGARGRGSHGLRYGGRVSGLLGYRSTSYVVQADGGRDFVANDALSLDATVSYWRTKDKGQTDGCVANNNAFDDCFGATKQGLLDVGASVLYRPSAAWMLVTDYHWLLEKNVNEESLKAHVLFFRLGYRY
jgi:hypothetical protein